MMLMGVGAAPAMIQRRLDRSASLNSLHSTIMRKIVAAPKRQVVRSRWMTSSVCLGS